MGISTLLGVPVKERLNFYAKHKQKKDKAVGYNLPKGYLLFSLSCLSQLEKIYTHYDSLPNAIIVDLDVFSIDEIGSVLNQLKNHPHFSSIPIIGIANHDKKLDATSLLKAGLDDCFFSPIDWKAIQKRVRFIAEFRQLQKSEVEDTSLQAYNIPLGKRVFDILIASIVLTSLSPILLLVAVLIKLESKGPLFYTSKRIGTGYQEFDFIKFRSMCVDADTKLQKLAHLNSYDKKSTNTDTFFKIKNDPKILLKTVPAMWQRG